MKAIGLLGLVSVAIVACGGTVQSPGGGGPGSASVQGTAGGQPVTVFDSAGLFGTTTINGVSTSYAGLATTSKAGTCGLLQQNANPANASALVILVASAARAGTAPPISTGTYTISASPITTASIAVVGYTLQDANCNKTVQESGQSGTVTLTTASSMEVAGSFDVTFGSGDHLTGTFSAPTCNFDLGTLVNQPPTACMH